MLIASDVTNIVGLAQEYSLMGVHNKLCKLYILNDNSDAHVLNNLLSNDFLLQNFCHGTFPNAFNFILGDHF